MRRLDLFVISFAIALPAAAEIYQWRDAQGRVHFSDTPPVGENATTRGAPAPKAPPRTPAKDSAEAAPAGPGAKGANEPAKGDEPAKPKTLAEKELEFRQRRAAAAEADAKAASERQRAAERQRDCERAHNQLAALESGQRMARFGAGGEREVLDDAAREEELARGRRFVESACK